MIRKAIIGSFVTLLSIITVPAFSQDMTDIQEKLDSSVVSSRAPAITRRGDTLVMNVGKAKTLDYDKLADLLKQYPGVSVENNKLYLNGDEVKKILLNGKMIFGDNVSAPLDLVLAKMVKGIRSWREYDRGRLVEGDTLGAKQRVVDVLTTRPVDNFRVLDLFAGGGTTTQDPVFVGEAGADYSKFAENVPQMVAKLYGGIDMSAGQIVSMPTDNVLAILNITGNDIRKLKYSSTLSFSGLKTDTENITDLEYSNGYRQLNESITLGHQTSAAWSANISKSFSGKNVLAADIQASYTGQRNSSLERLNMTGNTPVYSEQSVRNRSDNLTFHTKLHWRHRFAKNGRHFVAETDFGRARLTGTGETVDTLPVSDIRRWLAYTTQSPSTNVRLHVRYADLFFNKIQLNAGYTFTANLSRDNNLWSDSLLKADYLPSSRSYKYLTTEHRPETGMSYKGEHIDVAAGLYYVFLALNHNDLLHGSEPLSRSFFFLVPRLTVAGHYPGVNFSLNYSESYNTPSAIQLSRYIDTSNPFVFTAGNPNLDVSVQRRINAAITYIAFPISTTFQLYANAMFASNPVVSDIRTFAEDTFLEEYGITAPAGSRLSRSVNAGQARDYELSFLANTAIQGALSFILQPQFRYSQMPFITEGIASAHVSKRAGLYTVAYTTFSERISFNLSCVPFLGREYQGDSALYNFFDLEMNTMIRWNIGKMFSFYATGNYHRFKTDDGQRSFATAAAAATVEYHFPKNPDAVIYLKGCNLLDRDSGQQVTVMDDYIKYSRTPYLGRALVLGFKYTLRKY